MDKYDINVALVNAHTATVKAKAAMGDLGFKAMGEEGGGHLSEAYSLLIKAERLLRCAAIERDCENMLGNEQDEG